MDKFLVICGPTATGKTKLGVELARKFNGEILSADSRQVYKGMDIATGKDLKEYGEIKVWGIDLVNPDYSYNVSDYVRYANGVLEDIAGRGKLPIIVGGTGQYIKELLRPSDTLHIPQDEKLRARLNNCSVGEFQKELQEIDGKKWASMNESDQRNPRRLVRAIEVAERSGGETKVVGSGIKDRRVDMGREKNVLVIGLMAPYPYLYERIDRRVEERVRNGMGKEVERLAAAGYSLSLPSMSGLGYREFPDVNKWKFNEHAYARRQMTYFRNQFPEIRWFDVSGSGYCDSVKALVAKWKN